MATEKHRIVFYADSDVATFVLDTARMKRSKMLNTAVREHMQRQGKGADEMKNLIQRTLKELGRAKSRIDTLESVIKKPRKK